ncbi:hypothetical protein ACP275_06G030700 [Erythranthe tilingii]
MEYYECSARHALDYIMVNGIYLESQYKFKGKTSNKRMISGERIRIEKIQYFSSTPSKNQVKKILQKGHPILAEIYMSPSFSSHRGEHVYRTDPGKPKNGMHSIVVIGTGYDNGDLYCEIRNSWGSEWGAGGNAKVLASFVHLVGYIEGAYLEDE